MQQMHRMMTAHTLTLRLIAMEPRIRAVKKCKHFEYLYSCQIFNSLMCIFNRLICFDIGTFIGFCAIHARFLCQPSSNNILCTCSTTSFYCPHIGVCNLRVQYFGTLPRFDTQIVSVHFVLRNSKYNVFTV